MRKGDRLLLLSVLLLALPSLQQAYTIDRPQLAVYSRVVLDENGTVTVVGGELRDIDINLSIPLSSAYQEVQVSDTVLTDQDGNKYVKIYSEDPQNPFHYSRTISVQTSARTVVSFPPSYIIPQAYSKYAAPTFRTQSDNAAIRALALQVTANSTDPFERVAKLAIYVNKYLTYNDQLVGEENDAVWTLENRQGVCVEYSTLFAALARSIGIPVRYINGYVYSEKYGGWLGHAWNEAYIGEWVPVDATWFEVGSLDALHIEAGKFRELTREPALIASVSRPSAEILWETTGKSGAFANNIFTEDIELAAPESDFSLVVAEDELPPGSSTLAYLTITGKDYRVIQITLSACTGAESVEVKDEEQYAILRPGRTTVVAWELRSSGSLSDNYIYTCPLTLNSPYLENRVIEVQVDPRRSEPGHFEASLEKKYTFPGENNSAILDLPSNRRGKYYHLVTPDGAYFRRLSNAVASLPFYSAGPGVVPIYVAAESGGFRKLEYQSQPGYQQELSITGFAIPEISVEGKPARATVSVSAKNYPADVRVQFEFEGRVSEASGRISAPDEFGFEFLPTGTGSKQAQARLLDESGSMLDEENALVSVDRPPQISIFEIKAAKSPSGLSVDMSFASVGNPVGPTVKILGTTYSATKELELRMNAGDYEAEFAWQDMAGNNYTSQERFSVREPGLFENLGAKAGVEQSPQPCPLALALLALPFSLAFFLEMTQWK